MAKKAEGLVLAENLVLPIEAVSQTFGVLGIRGSGKTYALLKLVEEFLLAGQQVVVVDPLGVAWGLRLAADGKGEGLPIHVFGGGHGDVAIVPAAGGVIADFVVDQGVSAVLDLRDFEPRDMVRFMTDFTRRLFERKKSRPSPLHLVFDEADMFAPQRPGRGVELLLQAMNDLVRRGRVFGLGVSVATQRPAVVDKNVINQVQALLAFRLVGELDVRAIEGWIGHNGSPEERKLVLSSLASLPVGQAWFWSPGWLKMLERVEIGRRRTYDSSSTPTAEMELRVPGQLASVDLAALGEMIAGLSAGGGGDRRRSAGAGDVEEPEPRVVVQRVEVPVIRDDQLERVEKLLGDARGVGESLNGLVTELVMTVGALERAVAAVRRPADGENGKEEAPPAAAAVVGAGSSDLRPGALKMLRALVRVYPLRLTGGQLAGLVGVKRNSPEWYGEFALLKRRGFVEQSGDELVAAPSAFEHLGVKARLSPVKPAELQGMWHEVLRPAERRILDVLVAESPRALDRKDLAKRAGMAEGGGAFAGALNVLVRNELVDREGRGSYTASAVLVGDKGKG